MVSQIKFKNFKIFKEWQTLELRPITILIGKNNSGKSAVTKLPTLISPPLRGELLNWVNKVGDDLVELGTYFVDLIYQRNATGTIELAILNQDVSSKIELAYNKDYGILEYKQNGVLKENVDNIRGFLIDGNTIPDLSLNIDYIGAIRIEPNLTYVSSQSSYSKIGIKGQNAYDILISDYRQDAAILTSVSTWYEQNLGGWKIEIKARELIDNEQMYEIKLSKGRLETHIRQTGQGIHQALPLIVRSYMPENEPTLIIVEEPETHLHPAVHGVLAQRFVESYLEDNNRKYLIETHSQNFVLRMRRLVAERKLNPEDLGIYYVDFDEQRNESNLRRIEVDRNGDLPNDDWPSGIFNETSLEVKGIIQAQRNQNL